jgi:hypothetical protein
MHKEKPFERRLKESNDIIAKYPDRVCLYIEKHEKCKTVPDLEKKNI